jgi:hypothetical protein
MPISLSAARLDGDLEVADGVVARWIAVVEVIEGAHGCHDAGPGGGPEADDACRQR